MKAPKLCQLKDLCIGKTTGIRQKDLLVKGEHPVYGASGIVGFSQRELHPKPYVVVVKDGAGVGRAFVAEGGSSILGTMQALIPKGNVDCRYLLYLVKSLRLGSERSGATIPHIYFNKYSHKLVPYYSKDHQKAIADSLRQIELLIEKRCGQRNGLYRLVQSRFIEMFGDVSVNDRKWPFHRIDELYHVTSAKRLYAKELMDEGVPFWRLADLNKAIDGEEVVADQYVSLVKYAELKRSGMVPNIGDLLVTARGTLGKCYVVQTDASFYFQDGMITWLQSTDASPESSYLIRAFSDVRFAAKYLRGKEGSTVSYLSLSDIGKIPLPMPPLSLQREFAAFAESVDKSQVAIKREIEKLETLKKALMQEYFG